MLNKFRPLDKIGRYPLLSAFALCDGRISAIERLVPVEKEILNNFTHSFNNFRSNIILRIELCTIIEYTPNIKYKKNFDGVKLNLRKVTSYCQVAIIIFASFSFSGHLSRFDPGFRLCYPEKLKNTCYN